MFANIVYNVDHMESECLMFLELNSFDCMFSNKNRIMLRFEITALLVLHVC